MPLGRVDSLCLSDVTLEDESLKEAAIQMIQTLLGHGLVNLAVGKAVSNARILIEKVVSHEGGGGGGGGEREGGGGTETTVQVEVQYDRRKIQTPR
jgi:hypothetical protein